VGRIVILDAGPLGLASNARNKPEVDRCRDWISDLGMRGARVVIPEIADYEVRRELIRIKASAGIARLDQFESTLEYEPITTPAMRLASDLWALVRQGGRPTADPHALDGDCILAAQALVLGRPGDVVSIATTNPVHLSRFPGVDARLWHTITS
jgi:predicted nucleic acid-binding protein